MRGRKLPPPGRPWAPPAPRGADARARRWCRNRPLRGSAWAGPRAGVASAPAPRKGVDLSSRFEDETGIVNVHFVWPARIRGVPAVRWIAAPPGARNMSRGGSSARGRSPMSSPTLGVQEDISWMLYTFLRGAADGWRARYQAALPAGDQRGKHPADPPETRPPGTSLFRSIWALPAGTVGPGSKTPTMCRWSRRNKSFARHWVGHASLRGPDRSRPARALDC